MPMMIRECKKAEVDDFDTLLDLVSIIQSPRIRNEVRRQLLAAPKYFKEIPASTTGMHHPSYTMGYGGLVRHTIAVTKLASHICDLAFLRVGQRQRDQILAACFLHDVCKKGTGDTPDADGFDIHPKLAADRARDGSDDFAKIARLILVHMGQFGNNKPANIHEFIVHLADYLASRKDVRVDVGR